MFPPVFAIATALLAGIIGEYVRQRRIRRPTGNPATASQTAHEHEQSVPQQEQRAGRERPEVESSAHRGGADRDGERDASENAASDGGSIPAALAHQFAVLGLEPGASIEQIKAAHRKLALQFHPDRLPDGATEAVRDLVKAKMQSLNIARDILLAEANSRGRADRS